MDGALGFWKALDETFPATRHQRCWVHKLANVLNHFPKSMQPSVTANLREVSHAETRAAALAAIETFREKYGAKYTRAVACLTKDTEALLAFYDFPAEHSHDRSQAFLQGDLAGGTGDKILWMCKARDGTETTVEQTLIRGLVAA